MEHFQVRLKRLHYQYKSAGSFKVFDLKKNEELNVLEKETEELVARVENCNREIEECSAVLREDPKLRKKLEGSTLSQKKVSRLNKKKRSLKIHTNRNQIEILRERIMDEERKERKYWEVLEAIFEGYHHLFRLENQLNMKHDELGLTLLNHKKEVDLYTTVQKEVNISKNFMDKALENLREAKKNDDVAIEKQKEPPPKRGISYFSVDMEEDNNNYKQQNLIGESRTSLHKSYQKLFNAKLYVPSEQIFQQVRRSNDTQSQVDPKSVTFGNARRVLDVFMKTPGGGRSGVTPKQEYRSGGLDRERTEAAIAILSKQQGILNLIVEWVTLKLKKTKEVYDGIRSKCRALRNDVVKERCRIIDNFDKIYSDYKKQTQLNFVIDTPQFLESPNILPMSMTTQQLPQQQQQHQQRFLNRTQPIIPVMNLGLRQPVVPVVNLNSNNTNTNTNNINFSNLMNGGGNNQGDDNNPNVFYI